MKDKLLRKHLEFDGYTIKSVNNLSERLYNLELKVNLLLNNLGLEYQDVCRENLPKIVKYKSGRLI